MIKKVYRYPSLHRFSYDPLNHCLLSKDQKPLLYKDSTIFRNRSRGYITRINGSYITLRGATYRITDKSVMSQSGGHGYVLVDSKVYKTQGAAGRGGVPMFTAEGGVGTELFQLIVVEILINP